MKIDQDVKEFLQGMGCLVIFFIIFILFVAFLTFCG